MPGKTKLYWIAGGLGLLAAFYAMARHSTNQPVITTAREGDATGGAGGTSGLAGLPAVSPTPGSSNGGGGSNALFGILPGGGGWDASPPTIRRFPGVPPAGVGFTGPPVRTK